VDDGVDCGKDGGHRLGSIEGVLIRRKAVGRGSGIGRLGEIDLVDLLEGIQIEDQDIVLKNV